MSELYLTSKLDNAVSNLIPRQLIVIKCLIGFRAGNTNIVFSVLASAVYRSTDDGTYRRYELFYFGDRALSYPSPANRGRNVIFIFRPRLLRARVPPPRRAPRRCKMRKYVFATRRALIPKRTKETQVFTQPARGSNAPVYECLRTAREWPRFHDSRRRENDVPTRIRGIGIQSAAINRAATRDPCPLAIPRRN